MKAATNIRKSKANISLLIMFNEWLILIYSEQSVVKNGPIIHCSCARTPLNDKQTAPTSPLTACRPTGKRQEKDGYCRLVWPLPKPLEHKGRHLLGRRFKNKGNVLFLNQIQLETRLLSKQIIPERDIQRKTGKKQTPFCFDPEPWMKTAELANARRIRLNNNRLKK